MTKNKRKVLDDLRLIAKLTAMSNNGNSTKSGFVENAHFSFVAMARCARNIVDATLDTVAALDTPDALPAADRDDDWSLITRGIVRGAIDFGADMGAVGEGMMLGAIRSARSPDYNKTQTIKSVAEIGLHETIALGGDFEAMASGLACGATEGGREVGGDDATFLGATAEGAFTGAQRCGHFLQERLEKAMKRTRTPMASFNLIAPSDMRE